MRIIIVLLATVIAMSRSVAVEAKPDDNIEYYSSNTLGVSLPSFEEGAFRASVYLFADESTCFTCLASIRNMYAGIRDTGVVDFILFVRTRNPAFIPKIREHYKYRFRIESDPVSAYHKVYNVFHDPYVMVLDAKGVLRFHGVPGSVSFAAETYTQVLSDLIREKQREVEHDTSVQVSHLPVRYSGDSMVVGDNICSGVYLPQLRRYLYWGKNLCSIFLLDEMGRVLKNADFRNQGFGVPLFEFGNVNVDSMIVLNMHQNGLDAFTYDMNSGILKRRHTIEPTTSHYPSYLVYRLRNRKILQGLRYAYEDSLVRNAEFPSLWLWDASMNKKRQVAVYDEITRNNPVRRFFHQGIAELSGDTIAVVESMSTRIHLYNHDFVNMGVIDCRFDSLTWNYRQLASIRAIEGGPIKLYKQLADSVTRVAETQGLLYDSSKKTLYVVYEKKTTGANGMSRPRFFLHKVSEPFSHWALPEYDKPIAVHDGTVHCVSSRDGVATISRYVIAYLRP